jgi:hypothetical protein
MHLEYRGSILSQHGPCEIIDQEHPRWPHWNYTQQGRYTVISFEGHRLVRVRPQSIWIVND